MFIQTRIWTSLEISEKKITNHQDWEGKWPDVSSEQRSSSLLKPVILLLKRNYLLASVSKDADVCASGYSHLERKRCFEKLQTKPPVLGEPTAKDRAVLHARALVRCRHSPRAHPHLPTPPPVGNIMMLAHNWHLLIEIKTVNAKNSDQMQGSTLISVSCVECGWLSPHLWQHLPLWPLVISPLHWSRQHHPSPLIPSTLGFASLGCIFKWCV